MRQKTPFLREFFNLVKPYWTSEEKWKAWLLLLAIVGMNLGLVYVNVLLNDWNNAFYNALQNLDKDAFFSSLMRFSWLAGAYIVLAVYMLYLSQMLQIRWRTWVTGSYLDKWLKDNAYYRLQLLDSETDNPDQRISEDIDRLVDRTLTLSMRLLRAVVSLVSFVAILWHLSGPLAVSLGSYSLPLLGSELVIPGYMVWAAIAYALVGTWLTMRVGSPLIRLNYHQQRLEADFRYSLVRLRENSESVAVYGGEEREKDTFARRFADVVGNFRSIMLRQKKLTWLTAGYNQLSVIFPLVVAAPRFFSGAIQLGGLMQISSAFGHVHDSLSYLVNSYTEIAELRAVVERLQGFSANIRRIEELKALEEVSRHPSADALRIDSLHIKLPDGTTLARDLNLDLKPGDSLLITGPSGVGKSTLLRALAGIWPFGKGRIHIPEGSAMFLSQKPYLPLGTLREALSYPRPVVAEDGASLPGLLELCGLSHLEGRLDEAQNWSATLSPGEQQRVAFVRALLHRPDCLFLDEASASLDEPTEARLYGALREHLPRSVIVSVGHRSTLGAWHTYHLRLASGGSWHFGPQGVPAPEPAAA